MASTFKIIQAGKAQMVLRIIFGQCLGQIKDEVFTTGTAYIGNKTYDFFLSEISRSRITR